MAEPYTREMTYSTGANVKVVYDNPGSSLWIYGQRVGAISQSAQSALWAQYRDVNNTDDNPTTLGHGGLSRMALIYDEEQNEAWIYLGIVPVKVFKISAGLMRVVWNQDRERYSPF